MLSRYKWDRKKPDEYDFLSKFGNQPFNETIFIAFENILTFKIKINILMGQIIIIVIVFGLALLILRLFGAWMLRIDEVIVELKGIRSELRNNKQNSEIKTKDDIEEPNNNKGTVHMTNYK